MSVWTETEVDWVPEPPPTEHEAEPSRRLVLTSASVIQPRRVRWLWEHRIALGTLALMAGREGLGKSTCAYAIVGQITRGTLPGEYHGQSRAALICATEDSWEHTIVPRLMAAGADLALVYRVDVISADSIQLGLSLPKDLRQVEDAARQVDAALLLLDPLMSRLDSKLDTHRDAEVRRALEPLVTAADRTGMAVLGLMHHNKSGSADPLQLVMGSKAFTAVARSVHTVVPDPDDDTDSRRLFGTPKNNLGTTDLPTLGFVIEPFAIETDDGTAWTGRLVWGSESTASITDAMKQSGDEDRSATSEAADWLEDYLTDNGGVAASTDIKRDGGKEGHSQDCLKRARKRINAAIESSGFPRKTYWVLPVGAQSEQPRRGDTLTTPTAPTGAKTTESVQLVQPVQSAETPAPTLDYGDTTAAKITTRALEAS